MGYPLRRLGDIQGLDLSPLPLSPDRATRAFRWPLAHGPDEGHLQREYRRPTTRMVRNESASFAAQLTRRLTDGTPHRATNIPNNGLIRYWLPPGQERVLVTSAKGLSEVLVTRNYDFEKPAMLKWSIGRILGNGLLFAEGDEHKRQRKNLMPAFAFRHVKDLYPVFWGKSAECVRAMTEQIRTAPAEPAEGGHHPDEKQAAAAAPPPPSGSSSVMEVGNWASRATLDIIGIAGLGRDFGAIRDPDNELNQTYRELFAPSKAARMLQLLNLILPGWLVYRLPVKRNGDVGVAAEKIRQVCRELVQEKAAKLREAGGLDDADVLSVATESGGVLRGGAGGPDDDVPGGGPRDDGVGDAVGRVHAVPAPGGADAAPGGGARAPALA